MINILNISSFLKSETANLHRLVENRLSKIIFHRNLSASIYLDVLLSMQNGYAAMEAEVKKHSSTKDLMMTRSKLDWLSQDIHYLRKICIGKHQPNFEDVEVTAESAEEAIGMMYVMEGATLGGEHIYQRLTKHDWLTDNSGLLFFTSYGDNRMQQWRAFIDALETFYDEENKNRHAIKKGADKAFMYMYDSLRHLNHE